MTKTKIRISPLKEDQVQLALELDGITKDDLIEVDNSYLFEVKKAAKSGNELLFTIFFNKRFFNKKVVKEGNPSLTMESAKKLLSIKITAVINESEIKQNEDDSSYSIETEVANDIPFTVKFNVSEKYFREKVTEKRRDKI